MSVMRILSIIAYIIGSGLLITSCFIMNLNIIFWIGLLAVILLITGGILQFNTKEIVAHSYVRHDDYLHHR